MIKKKEIQELFDNYRNLSEEQLMHTKTVTGKALTVSAKGDKNV